MKTFYGCTFIEEKDLEEAGIHYPIKLEYYRTKVNEVENAEEAYGIEVIKTAYLDKITAVERANVEGIAKNEEETNQIIEILKKYKVTPITVQDVVNDLCVKNKKIS